MVRPYQGLASVNNCDRNYASVALSVTGINRINAIAYAYKIL